MTTTTGYRLRFRQTCFCLALLLIIATLLSSGGKAAKLRFANQAGLYQFVRIKLLRGPESRKINQSVIKSSDVEPPDRHYHKSVIKTRGLDAVTGASSVCRSGIVLDPNVIVVHPNERVGRQQLTLPDIIGAISGRKNPTVYLRGGLYRLMQPLILTASVNGATLMACPGEVPVIEGEIGQPLVILRQTHGVSIKGLLFSGASSAQVALEQASASTIEGNTFVNANTALSLDHSDDNLVSRNILLHSSDTGIEIKDQSNGNIVADNIIDGAGASETNGGGIFLHGTFYNRISHNLVQNTSGFGIGILNWDDATVNVGDVVEYNLIRNTAATALDSGAVYVLGRSQVDTSLVIAGNVIDEFGLHGQHVVGIYLDDSTGGVTVARNLVRRGGSDAVQIHGGSDNVIQNNILDLGNARTSAVLFQAAPEDTHPTNLQVNNLVYRNIIMSTSEDPKQFPSYGGGYPNITMNYYVSSIGKLPMDSDVVHDYNPFTSSFPSLARTGAEDGYEAVQAAAAAAISFKPFDLISAGPRTRVIE